MSQAKKEATIHGPDPKDLGFNEHGGYTYKAIAEILEISPSRVHQILVRALKKLSEQAKGLK
jgi:DNA-directed RNA polymerase sigma subunit (sigma70/sigma32)